MLGLLVESTRRIQQALPAQVQVYLVDPSNPMHSAFFANLGLPEHAYVQMSWVPFMNKLAGRLLEECRAEIESACRALVAAEGWEDTGIVSLCSRLTQLGLVKLGWLRARWTQHDGAYLPRHAVQSAWFADLLLAVGLIEQLSGSEGLFVENGIVEFRRDNQILGAVALAHGRGIRRWLALEAEVRQCEHYWQHHQPRPLKVLISGVVGDRPPSVAPPPDIAYQDEEQSIVAGGPATEMYTVDQLRNNPKLIGEVLL